MVLFVSVQNGMYHCCQTANKNKIYILFHPEKAKIRPLWWHGPSPAHSRSFRVSLNIFQMKFTARGQEYPVEYVPAAGYAVELCRKNNHGSQARASGTELKWMRNKETEFVFTYNSNVITTAILQAVVLVKQFSNLALFVCRLYFLQNMYICHSQSKWGLCEFMRIRSCKQQEQSVTEAIDRGKEKDGRYL